MTPCNDSHENNSSEPSERALRHAFGNNHGEMRKRKFNKTYSKKEDVHKGGRQKYRRKGGREGKGREGGKGKGREGKGTGKEAKGKKKQVSGLKA